MEITCIQHADFETPGIIEKWSKERGHNLRIFKPYNANLLPSLDQFELLILMGRPQSPLDRAHLPYLQHEIDFLKQAIAAHKHVLGFCLGAQLIGEALGGKTQRSPEKEVGVFPITLTEEGKRDPLFYDFPASFPVIHWHNDMPGSTEDAVLVAASEGCPRQGYRYKTRVYGLQFHMEITKEGIQDLIEHVPHDLEASRFTQSQEELLQNDYDAINQRMYVFLDRFICL